MKSTGFVALQRLEAARRMSRMKSVAIVVPGPIGWGYESRVDLIACDGVLW